MPITVDSPIVGFVGGDFDWPANPKRPHDLADYFEELHRLCKLVDFDYRILVAQAWHETDGFTSPWWEGRLNPAGIGITGDPAQNAASRTWANGTEAARAHAVHMYAYVIGHSSWAGAYGAVHPYVLLDPRFEAVYEAGFDGTVEKLGDLGNGKWATDPDYAPQIAARANAIFADAGSQNQEETMPVYPVAGLPGPGIELPVPLVQRLLPISEFNRPGYKRNLPGYWVQHETDNYAPGAGAAMHASWLAGGPTDSEGNRQYVGFHFCVDDGLITQMIPIDEIGWHAADGAGPGNYSGIGCELCVNRGIDTAKARHNAEALAGGIMRALGMGADRCKRHWDFNAGTADRHHCPDTMMNDGYWPAFAANVGKIVAAKPVPPPSLASVPWDKDAVGPHKIGRTACLAYLGEGHAAREVPITDHIGAGAKTIATLQKDEAALIRGGCRPHGVGYVFVEIPGKGVGRARWSAFRERWPLPS